MSVKTEWEMACPKCGSDDRINIVATVLVRLTEDGTVTSDGDHEWDNNSSCDCGKCGHSGTVGDFEAAPPSAAHRRKNEKRISK